MGAHINTSTKRGAGQYLDLATLRVAYPTRYTPFFKSDHHDIEDSMALPPTNCDVNGQQSAVLGLYTGCPPGRAVHFDAVASYTDAIGRVLDHGCMQPTSVPKYRRQGTGYTHEGELEPLQSDTVPCVWAGHDFYPAFSMYDSVTGRTLPYNDSFRLTIVAGGSTLDTMQR